MAAAANLDRALYDFIPRLSGSASYFRLSKVESSSLGTVVVAPGAAPGPLAAGQPLGAAPIAFDSLQNATTVSASLTVPLSDYVFHLFQGHASAKAQLESSRFSLEATRRKVAYDARALYYDWVRAELEAAAAEQNLSLSREHLGRVQALASAESATVADVARIEATVAASEQIVVQSQNLVALQRTRLQVIMHDTSGRDYRIGEAVGTPVPERPELDDIGELTRAAERQRPELRAVALQAQAYDKQAAVARSRVLPRLDAIAQSTLANPNQRYFPQRDEFHQTWQVGVQLTFSPTDSLSAHTQVAVARAQADAARAQRSQLLDAARTEVSEAVLARRTARAGVVTSARRVTAAETSYRARHERFLAGQATTVELTEAQTELFNARLDSVQAVVALRLAHARIDYVAGN
jgi:outer membrane protein TolC